MNKYNKFRRAFRRIKLLGRAIVGKDLFPIRDAKLNGVDSFGCGYGEWWLLPGKLKTGSVIYSFGVGTDISFDLDILKRINGVEFHAFDPTPQVAEWLLGQKLPNEFNYHAYGLGVSDGFVSFSPPQDPKHISHSSVRSGGDLKLEVRSLASIMKSLNHSDIDLIKMDIEGAEYAVIEQLADSGIRPRQLLVEFHHRWSEIGVGKTRRALHLLKTIGYSSYYVSESGEEWSFIRD